MTAPERKKRSLESSWLSAVLLLPPLAWFGSVLIEKTHHRPLGAATFASAAVLAWIAVEIFVRSALDPEEEPGDRLRKIAWALGLVANLALFFWAFS